MSKVISFSAWKGRKQLVSNTASRPDVCGDGTYPEADEAITVKSLPTATPVSRPIMTP